MKAGQDDSTSKLAAPSRAPERTEAIDELPSRARGLQHDRQSLHRSVRGPDRLGTSEREHEPPVPVARSGRRPAGGALDRRSGDRRSRATHRRLPQRPDPQPLGRRRPFIVVGALTTSVVLVLFVHASSLAIAAAFLWLLGIGANLTMEPLRALTGDLVP